MKNKTRIIALLLVVVTLVASVFSVTAAFAADTEDAASTPAAQSEDYTRTIYWSVYDEGENRTLYLGSSEHAQSDGYVNGGTIVTTDGRQYDSYNKDGGWQKFLSSSWQNAWTDYRSSITHVVIESEIRPVYFISVFDDHEKLVDVKGLENFKLDALLATSGNAWSAQQGEGIFSGCTSLETIDVSGLDVSQLESFRFMFSNCTNLKEIDLSAWENDQVTDFYSMFSQCNSLVSIRFGAFTYKYTTADRVSDPFDYMFHFCDSLTNLDFSLLDISETEGIANGAYDYFLTVSQTNDLPPLKFIKISESIAEKLNNGTIPSTNRLVGEYTWKYQGTTVTLGSKGAGTYFSTAHDAGCTYSTNGFCWGCDGYQPATDSDGDGYYEIYNGGNLFWFAEQVNVYKKLSYKAILMNDIDLEGNKGRIWTPIGLATKDGETVTEVAVFAGEFDGNYHRIKNMTTDKTKPFQGLFGAVNGGATIREVIIDSSCTVQGTYFVAGVVAGAVGTGKTVIKNCGNEADVTAYGDATATNTGDRKGYNAAGILGVNWKSSIWVYIENCYNYGDIYGDKENGAISGWLGSTYDVINCLNTGTVTGADPNRPFARAERYVNNWFENNYSTAAGLEESYITTVTSNQLASGEVAYKLNGSTSGGSTWKQTLDVDAYPNFEGGTVYYPYTLCSGDVVYTNDSAKANVVEAHDFTENGFCTKYGCYQPAKLVTAATSTTNAVYEISNAGQMFWFAALVNGELTDVEKKSAVDAYLANDINLENRVWTPIANDPDYRDDLPDGVARTTVFNGVFDGRGHTISGLNIQANQHNSALFGLAYASTIKDFTLEGTITINAVNANNIASVVGFMGDTTVSGIISRVDIAFSDTADITLESYTDNLNYTRYIGGIVGKISREGKTTDHGGTISNCAYYGTIDIGDKYVDLVGGIIAYMWRDGGYGAVNDCGFYGKIVSDFEGDFTTNAGELKATVCIGGILGYSNHTGTKMTDCLVVGTFDVDGMTDTSEVTAFGTYGNVFANFSNLTGLYYLEGSVPNAYVAKATVTTAPKIYAVDAETLASGEVAYLLSHGVTDGTQVWYQTLGEGGDAYPSFTGGTVYQQKNCDGTFTGLYFNTESTAHVIGSVTANGATLTVTCDCGSYFVTYTVTAPTGNLIYDGVTAFKPTVESSWSATDVIFDGVMSPEDLVYTYTNNGTTTTDLTQAGTYSVRVALLGREGTAATVTYKVIMPEPLMNTEKLNDALEGKGVTAVYINGTLPAGWTMQADGTITNGTSTVEPINLTGTSSLSGVYLYIVDGAAYVVSAENITDYVKIDTSEEYTTTYLYFAFLDTVTKIDLTNLDTTGETDMSNMFYGCSALETIIFGEKFDTSAVTNMAYMFSTCSALKEIDLSKFDTSNVTSMKDMFWYCNTLTELDVTSFDTSNVTDMSGMFACGHLENIKFDESFVTSNVTDMSYMFYYDGHDNYEEVVSTTTNLQDFIDTFDTSKVTTMDYMFGKTWFTNLDLSGFETDALESATNMFSGGHLDELVLPEGFGAIMHTLGLNEFGNGWAYDDGAEGDYFAEFVEGTTYPAGTYHAHRHDDGEGMYYRFSVTEGDATSVDVYCFCGDHVHSYQIVDPGTLKTAGDGVTPVYTFEFVCTMCGEGANCHDGYFGIFETIYKLNEETGDWEQVFEVIDAGKYKVEMLVQGPGAVIMSYEDAHTTATATLEFTVEEKRDFELEGSIDASTDNYQNSTLLGNKPAIIINEAGKVTVITNYEIVTNDGVNALLLVPKFAEGFEIIGVSVNGTVCTWKPNQNASSSMVLANGWTVTFTGNEDGTYKGSFKIELDKEQGGNFTIDESTIGELFIQIIYQSTSDITENSRFEFGFDLDQSKAYTSVYEGTIAEDREVDIIVTNAVVDVIIRENGEITFEPDQSLEYDGEKIGAAEGSGLTAEELEELLKEYIVYYYNGFSFELPADLAAELEAAGTEIDWAQYITIKWYDSEGNELTEAPKTVGTYKIVITAAQNEFLSEATAELTFEITPYIFDATISGNPAEKPYNGSEQTWAEGELNHSAINRGDGYLKVDETKYTITGIVGAWTNAGEYTLEVTLTASDNYAFGYNEDGTAITEKTFDVAVKIAKLAISVTAEDKTSQYSDAILDLTYTADEEILAFIRNEIANGNLILTIETDATSDSVVGNYTIYITLTEKDGLNNYSEITVYNGIYKITRKVITIPTFDKEFTYNGLEQGYEQPAQVNGKDALGYANNKGTNAGKYTLTATLENNNYIWADSATNGDTLVRTFEWEIKAAKLEIVIGDYTAIYEELNKDNACDKVVGTPTGLVNGELLEDLIANGDIVYTIVEGKYSTDGNNYLLVGEYAITGADNSGNYEITFTNGKYTVNKKALAESLEELRAMITGSIKEYTGSTVTWTNGDFTFIYNGETSTLITISNAAAIDGTDYVNANGKLTDGAWSYYDPATNKYYTVTITLNDTENYVLYNGVGDAVTSLDGQAVEVFIRQADNSFVTGPTVNNTDDLAKLETVFDVEFGDDTAEDKKLISIKYFDEKGNEVAWADLKADRTYYVVVSVPENNNWAAIEAQQSFTTKIGYVLIPVVRVDSETGNIVLIGESGEVIYDGKAHELVVIPDGQGRYTVTLSRTGDWINAGTYTITVTIDENYKWQNNDEANNEYNDDQYNDTTETFTYTLVIAKREITITADNKEITYGDSAPEYTETVNNWVTTDSLADLLGDKYANLLSCVYGTEGNTNAGTYTITVTMDEAALEAILTNYDVTAITNGTLTVKKVQLTIGDLEGALDEETAKAWADLIANGLTVEYNSETHTVTVTGYDSTKVKVIVKYGGSETAPENAGTYPVTLEFVPLDENNYEVINWNADANAVTLEITKVKLNITTKDHTHTFDGLAATLPTLTAEELKALISRQDNGAIADFIYNEVTISKIYFGVVTFNTDGYTNVGTYDGVIYADNTYDETNYDIDFINGDLHIVIVWEDAVVNENRVYDGTSVTSPEDFYQYIENFNADLGHKIEYLYEGSTTLPKNAGTHTITVRFFDGDSYENSTNKDETKLTITIKKKDLNLRVDKVSANYLVNYINDLRKGIFADLVDGETFIPQYTITITNKTTGTVVDITNVTATDILSVGSREVGDYTITVSVANAGDTVNYNIYPTSADLTINKATLNGVGFEYNKNTASWTQITTSTDGELINKYGAVNVIYTVTNGEFSFETTDADAAWAFVADRTGTYTLTATVENGDANFIESTSTTAEAYSVSFADGEHSKNTSAQESIDAYIAALGTQIRFAGQTADMPVDLYTDTYDLFEGYDYGDADGNYWLLNGMPYDFNVEDGVTADITLNINWVIKTYKITWIGTDGTAILETWVAYLENPVFNGTEPTKAPDSKWTYTFGGWHNDVECAPVDEPTDLTTVYVKGEMTFYVHFEVEGTKYTVIFNVWNDRTGEYEVKHTSSETAYDTLLEDLYDLTNMAWFIHDVWYTDSGRTGEQLTKVPSSEDSREINLYGAYKFDIGTGDVNADGEVDADDITLYRKWIVGGYNMTVVEYTSIADIWDYVQTADFDVNATHFIVYVADTNTDSASDIRDITTVRMALVGGYGYGIVEGVNVTGQEIMITILIEDDTVTDGGIDYNVEVTNGMTVEKFGDRETVRITDDTIMGIKVKLSSVPENYDASGLTFTAVKTGESESGYVAAPEITVAYLTTDDGSAAYITVTGIDWTSSDVYEVTFDMDGEGTEYYEHNCTIVYEEPATE